MIFQNVEFHNVAELQTITHLAGLRMLRFPENVRHMLSTKGKLRAQESLGCEIRFVTKAPNIKVHLSIMDSGGDVLVMNGDFQHSVHRVEPGSVKTLLLAAPGLFDEVDPSKLNTGGFSSNVWRIMTNRYCAVFHGIETFGDEIRPPKPEELPKLRWISYGSSITHGAFSSNYHNCYVQQAAWRLGVDLSNLALSGACLCENEMADYFASRDDWDLITLEIGINMRGSFSAEDFGKRAKYLIETLNRKHPDKIVVLITVFPNVNHYEIKESYAGTNQEKMSQALRDLAASGLYSNLHLIEGGAILTDFKGLANDLVHPSDYGHTQMGENLAKELRPILAAYQSGR